MALIGNEKFSQNVLKVKGGGNHLTVIEAGSDVWIVEPGKTNRLPIYNNVIEQLAAQGYKLVSVNGDETTLQLDNPSVPENAGVTANYVVNIAVLPEKPVSIFDSHGLSDVSPHAQQQILEELRKGLKIQAIRILREDTPRRSLKEAKEAIDSIAKSVGVGSSSSGCVGVILIVCSTAGFLGTLLLRHI